MNMNMDLPDWCECNERNMHLPEIKQLHPTTMGTDKGGEYLQTYCFKQMKIKKKYFTKNTE